MTQRKAKRASILAIALTISCATAAAAQTDAKSWNLDGAALALFSPGVGAATNAVGLWASATVVRSTSLDEFGRHKCVGVTAVAATLWARSSAEFGETREHLFLVGPRWDSGDNDGTLYLQVLGGVGRVSAPLAPSGGAAIGSRTVFTVGAGLGLGIISGWRSLEVNWLFSPTSPVGVHRLLISTGLSFGTRLSPRHPKPNNGLQPSALAAIVRRRG